MMFLIFLESQGCHFILLSVSYFVLLLPSPVALSVCWFGLAVMR